MQLLTSLRVMIEEIIQRVSLPGGLTWLLFFAISLFVYRLITRWLERVMEHAVRGDRTRLKKPLRAWRITFWAIVMIIFISATGGNLAALGISAAFVGMIFGWSLQRPVTGIAAWLLVTMTRPFKIGNRVIIAGVIGDVKDIGIMYITMEQVGGTIGGEEKSGRAVLIPTAVLFDQVIFNYTMRKTAETEESKYILDEVVVRVSHDSPWDAAEAVLIAAARAVTPDIIKETGSMPFVRGEFIDWGVFMRLRYYTIPAQRQEISSNITRIVFREFAKSKVVRFAYPRNETDFTYKAKPVGPVAALCEADGTQ
jgi:small-conductance mechanosensitive channel